MSTFILYLIRVVFSSAVFWLFYHLALSRTTFFKLNRAVILLSVVLSLTLSFWWCSIILEKPVADESRNIIAEAAYSLKKRIDMVEIPIAPETQSEITAPSVQSTPKEPIQAIESATALDSATSANQVRSIALTLLIIYFIGVAAILAKHLHGHLQILYLLREAQRAEGPHPIYITGHSILPFSWLGRTFISRSDYEQNPEAILEHEQEHISLGHFYDLILMNLYVAFLWFDPFAHLLKKELITVHEFQADKHVTECGINAKQYQYLLIGKTACSTPLPVGNHLLSGSLKKRINMMQSKKTKPIKGFLYLLLLPAAFLTVAAFTTMDYVTLDNQFNNQSVQDTTNAKSMGMNISGDEDILASIRLTGDSEMTTVSAPDSTTMGYIYDVLEVLTKMNKDIKVILEVSSSPYPLPAGFAYIEYDQLPGSGSQLNAADNESPYIKRENILEAKINQNDHLLFVIGKDAKSTYHEVFSPQDDARLVNVTEKIAKTWDKSKNICVIQTDRASSFGRIKRVINTLVEAGVTPIAFAEPKDINGK